MKILVLNGPNLNMLGARSEEHYGTDTIDDINKRIKSEFKEHSFTFKQSNEEGELIDIIHGLVDSDVDALVANYGAFTHTSIALRDALELLSIPKVEVHLSNIHAREEFRRHSLTGEVSDGIITGFGSLSYILGVQAAIDLTK